MSSFFLKLFGEKWFVYCVNVFPASIKLIKPMQKYSHVIGLYACVLKMFILMFLLLINVLIPLGIRSTPKLSK